MTNYYIMTDVIDDNVDIDNRKLIINKIINKDLFQREQHILRLRFGFYQGIKYTLKEISENLDVSRERIRQIEKRALRKLKNSVRVYNKLHNNSLR